MTYIYCNLCRYDTNKTGTITPEEFRKLYRESILNRDENKNYNQKPINDELSSFEAGSIFAKFDRDGDGKLDKREFESMISQIPYLKPSVITSKVIDNEHPNIQSDKYSSSTIPVEILSGSVLTHYDETAGIAIPRSSVPTHESMGHVVHPLIESYQTRFNRLRAILTGKLLPRREHLLQLRRQLLNTSNEIEACRKNIERETIADSDRIIERLRTIESMRQSALHHQVI